MGVICAHGNDGKTLKKPKRVDKGTVRDGEKEKKPRPGGWLIGIEEVMERMHCGRTKAAEMIKKLNAELAERGYFLPKRGMTYRKYFTERIYV